MKPAVIAVDGGASKTHLALVARDGELLRLVRGPESQPHNVGFARALEVLDGLYAKAGGNGAADVAQLNMAGVDFPTEEEELRDAIEARGWAERTEVGNDTFAVLRAGTERGWGVAVVCGTGINCVGVSADGRHVRFPALGQITGDWGGGTDVGYAALYAAARSEVSDPSIATRIRSGPSVPTSKPAIRPPRADATARTRLAGWPCTGWTGRRPGGSRSGPSCCPPSGRPT